MVALYAHPIEHVVRMPPRGSPQPCRLLPLHARPTPQASNMIPAVMGPLVLGSHLSSITIWFSLALIVTTISHCGYHLPLLPSPEFHDYHHLK